MKKPTTFKTLPADALTVYAIGGGVALSQYFNAGLIPVGMYWCPACSGSGVGLSKMRRCFFCGGCGAVSYLGEGRSLVAVSA